jgi:hypothetical protein
MAAEQPDCPWNKSECPGEDRNKCQLWVEDEKRCAFVVIAQRLAKTKSKK